MIQIDPSVSDVASFAVAPAPVPTSIRRSRTSGSTEQRGNDRQDWKRRGRHARRTPFLATLTICCSALGGAMFGVAPPASAQTILARDIAPFAVTYSVGNNVITAGRASLVFARDGEHWRYSLATKPTGVFKLTGKGRIRESSLIDVVRTGDTVQLQPLSYSYRQDDERRRSVDATFDWHARTMSWKQRGEEGNAPFEKPVLDRLSVTLAVMSGLRNGFETLELEVFDKDRVKTMRFINEGREVLDTEIGEVETIRVRGAVAAGSSRSSLTWFAPSLDYVPVRIEQHKRDELVARLTLVRLKNRMTDIELDDSAANDAPSVAAAPVDGEGTTEASSGR